MMTACDLSAITKPWEVQSKVRIAFRGHPGSSPRELLENGVDFRCSFWVQP